MRRRPLSEEMVEVRFECIAHDDSRQDSISLRLGRRQARWIVALVNVQMFEGDQGLSGRVRELLRHPGHLAAVLEVLGGTPRSWRE